MNTLMLGLLEFVLEFMISEAAYKGVFFIHSFIVKKGNGLGPWGQLF